MQAVFRTFSRKPAWLHEAFERASRFVEGEIVVFEPNDLNRIWRRTACLEEKYRSLTGGDARKTFSADLLADVAHSPGGIMVTDEDQYLTTEENEQLSFTVQNRSSAPTKGLLLLFPSSYSTRSITASFSALPTWCCAVFSGIRPAESVFWHEVGHYHLRQTHEGQPFSPKEDESYADAFAYAHAPSSCATYYRKLRDLETFLLSVNEQHAAYWNPFSVDRPRSIPAHAEVASVLELKYRAAGLPLPKHTDPACAETFNYSCFRGPSGQALRSAYAPSSYGNPFRSVSLLRSLNKHAHAGRGEYIFPHTEELEERTLEAAYRLAPGVFGRPMRTRVWREAPAL